MARPRHIPIVKNPPKPRPWVEGFLKALTQYGGKVSLAARAVGIGVSTAYEYRNQSEEFAQRWDDAKKEGIGVLEGLLIKRATQGDMYERKTETRSVPDGQGNMVEVTITTEHHKITDAALIFALKTCGDPIYRDNVRVEQTGVDGQPIKIEVTRKRTAERVEELLRIARENENGDRSASANGA